MTEPVLEPGLTVLDKRVLRAVPTGGIEPATEMGHIAAKLRGLDVDVALTLRGLEHLGYVQSKPHPDGRKAWMRLYWRTARGDEALS